MTEVASQVWRLIQDITDAKFNITLALNAGETSAESFRNYMEEAKSHISLIIEWIEANKDEVGAILKRKEALKAKRHLDEALLSLRPIIDSLSIDFEREQLMKSLNHALKSY